MKKHGFTLAEVLITLGIIGVVAALTTPALMHNVESAKIGPKLRKFKSAFEQAVGLMLLEENANTLKGLSTDGKELMDTLSKYYKITYNEETYDIYQRPGSISNTIWNDRWRYDTEDGISILMLSELRNDCTVNTGAGYANIPSNQKVGTMYIDINKEERPNTIGKDVFRFVIYNDGTLRPYGARGYERSNEDRAYYWYEEHYCDEQGTNRRETCTGSIFDNGMKIIYE